jgi:hypothetical protein
MMLTRVGMRRICMGPWHASIWASSLKMSCARDATTGSGERRESKIEAHGLICKEWIVIAAGRLEVRALSQ